jgi:hypothetical protein
MNIYEGNSIAAFTNCLPEHIELEDNWEVALLEISFPSKFNNVTEGRLGLYVNDEYSTQHTLLGQHLECSISPGFYQSVTDVELAMQRAVKSIPPRGEGDDPEKRDVWKFEIDKKSRKGKFEIVDKEKWALYLNSPDLAHIFGFGGDDVFIGANINLESTFPVDICRFHSIIVYIDIIQHGIIGDTRAPVLRTLPFGTRVQSMKKTRQFDFDDVVRFDTYMTHVSFNYLQYKPLLKKNFNQISVTLRDQTGSLIPFQSIGHSRLTLGFRKVT